LLFWPYLRFFLIVVTLAAAMITVALNPEFNQATTLTVGVVILKTLVDWMSHGLEHVKPPSEPGEVHES
jgi:hypothetical protein